MILRKKQQDSDSSMAERGSDMDEEHLSNHLEEGATDGSDGDSAESALEEECEKLRAEARESHEKFLRALADLDNFKRRAAKERNELRKYEGERVLFDMLEVLDNFERALENVPAEQETIRAGIELIHKQFVAVLERYEVRGESSVGKPFDPTRHNALSKQPAGAEVPANTVVHELKKAYMFKDKLLRPAEVVVAVAEDEQEAGTEEGLVH